MEITIKKIFLNWEEFSEGIEILTKLIKTSKFKFDGIYAPPRGGLPLAVAMSHRLNIPLLLSPTEKTLVVDDIIDTGETLHKFRKNKIATIYSTKWTITKPTWWIWEKEKKTHWIIFPWEKL